MMEQKIFIDIQNNKIGGICKAKDFKKQIEQLKNDLQGAAI